MKVLLKVQSPSCICELQSRQTRERSPVQVCFAPLVGPLDLDALSKLSHHLGHSVCGKMAASRCSQCQPLWYCGSGALHRELRFHLPMLTFATECQRADWPEHKRTCKSLKGGRYRLPAALTPSADPGRGHVGAPTVHVQLEHVPQRSDLQRHAQG